LLNWLEDSVYWTNEVINDQRSDGVSLFVGGSRADVVRFCCYRSWPWILGKPVEVAAVVPVMDFTWAKVKLSFYCSIAMFKMIFLISLTVAKEVGTALLARPSSGSAKLVVA
jgi:hypothetical protein